MCRTFSVNYRNLNFVPILDYQFLAHLSEDSLGVSGEFRSKDKRKRFSKINAKQFLTQIDVESSISRLIKLLACNTLFSLNE